MNKLFNVVKLTKPKSNFFDLSHERKMSLNMGSLVPAYVEEIIPGDRFKVKTEMLLRMAPMVAPVMHRVNAYMHYFFVPNRLVWSNWETFITGGATGLLTASMPTLDFTDADRTALGKGKLPDYLANICWPAAGPITDHIYINALPFRAYQLIYNEYYRDQTLQTAVPLVKTDATTDKADIIVLRKRCWEKDYYTSSLPWTQRGGEVLLPGTADYRNGGDHIVKAADGSAVADGTVDVVSGHLQMASGADNDTLINDQNLDGYNITINDLRRASRLQAWLERNAVGGSRYVEQILAHFGIKSSDARLQRPEYLGGGKTAVTISEVLNTSSTATEPQGNMAGHGIGVGVSNYFNKRFEEHGYVIGILSVLPRTAYQRNIPRTFLKTDKYDYFWPELAHIGEQPVKNAEMWLKGVNADDIGTFGYQSRYAEYKFKQSSVHGDFTDNLSHWHLGRIFTSQPALNSAFVEADPTHRAFAVTDTSIHKIYCMLYNDVKAIRPMPKFGTPGVHIV